MYHQETIEVRFAGRDLEAWTERMNQHHQRRRRALSHRSVGLWSTKILPSCRHRRSAARPAPDLRSAAHPGRSPAPSPPRCSADEWPVRLLGDFCERRLLAAGECLQVAQRRDHVLGAVAGDDKLAPGTSIGPLSTFAPASEYAERGVEITRSSRSTSSSDRAAGTARGAAGRSVGPSANVAAGSTARAINAAVAPAVVPDPPGSALVLGAVAGLERSVAQAASDATLSAHTSERKVVIDHLEMGARGWRPRSNGRAAREQRLGDRSATHEISHRVLSSGARSRGRLWCPEHARRSTGAAGSELGARPGQRQSKSGLTVVTGGANRRQLAGLNPTHRDQSHRDRQVSQPAQPTMSGSIWRADYLKNQSRVAVSCSSSSENLATNEAH